MEGSTEKVNKIKFWIKKIEGNSNSVNFFIFIERKWHFYIGENDKL
jgi:hypothetical protein